MNIHLLVECGQPMIIFMSTCARFDSCIINRYHKTSCITKHGDIGVDFIASDVVVFGSCVTVSF